MYALTLKQPWASFVAYFRKDIENRKWRPRLLNVGDRFAIHAGYGVCDVGMARLAHVLRSFPGLRIDLPRGALVAVATFCGVVTDGAQLGRESRAWFEGPIGWCLGNVMPIANPIHCTGGRGLWQVDERARTLVA